jgi:hypothetical protein
MPLQFGLINVASSHLYIIIQLSETIVNICYDCQKGLIKAHMDQAAITKELRSLCDVLEGPSQSGRKRI